VATFTTSRWNQLQREYVHTTTKLGVTITGTAAKTYTYRWERAGTGMGEWWGTILHYSELPAISVGSNKCYAQMLRPGDIPQHLLLHYLDLEYQRHEDYLS
jgi:hypothetical protein